MVSDQTFKSTSDRTCYLARIAKGSLLSAASNAAIMSRSIGWACSSGGGFPSDEQALMVLKLPEVGDMKPPMVTEERKVTFLNCQVAADSRGVATRF
ncbi:hypothetical protein [Prescottella agglutinans]|nr:hypothetical protein [Prescottella agglutinans]